MLPFGKQQDVWNFPSHALLDADIRNSYAHATASLSVSPVQEGSTLPEADAPTLGPDPGSISVSTPPTSGPLPGDPQLFPASIGRYRILRLLGQGGMGMVYEAEQDFPQRIVALKLIRAGYATGEMLRRFENETQALGRLQHPGIAQIYDAGAVETPIGKQPYIAMELVRGQTLLDSCDSRKLKTRERLELMAKICDAVHHAHQRGLIHRDLKPANILVGEDGQPKILDFGVARLTDSDAQATRQTNMGEIIGTLAYMSPEQVSGEAADIDTRSDVYALGVILYELLSGQAPYTIGRQIHEAVRAIRQDEPTALSSVNRTYRGDIETIVARALEKDKTRRYGSAAELAADIRRYLHDEPILARPPSTTYQLQKFARRHKALVSGIAAVFVVLALGVAASTWEAVQARRAQKVSERQTREAERQTAIAKAVNDFLQNDLLGQANLYAQAKPDPNLSVHTVLDRATANIGGKFKDQPEVEAAIRDTVGRTDNLMGLVPQAKQQLEQALSLSRRALGPEDPATLAIMADLADVYVDAGKYSEAEKLYSQAVEVDRRVLGKENRQTLSATTELALTYSEEGKYAQSEALLKPTLELEERLLGPADRNTREAMDRLAWVYYFEQKYGLAETLDKRLLEIDLRDFGPQSAVVFRDMYNLANTYNNDGKYPQAEALASQVVEFERKMLGLDNKRTLASMDQLLFAYKGEKKYTQAEALGQQTLERQRRVIGSEDPDTLSTEETLAEIYRLEGRFRLSESVAMRALETARRVPGPATPDTAETLALLARDYATEGRYSEAEDVFRQYSQGSSPNPEVAPDPEIDRAFAWFLLTAPDPARRDPARALGLARTSLQSEPDNPDRLKTLGLAEVQNGLWDEAIGTLTKAAALHGGTDPKDLLLLAQAYQGRGDAADAGSNYERAVTLLVDVATADPDDVALWRETAAALGKPAPSSSKKSASKSAGTR